MEKESHEWKYIKIQDIKLINPTEWLYLGDPYQQKQIDNMVKLLREKGQDKPVYLVSLFDKNGIFKHRLIVGRFWMRAQN